MALEGVLSKEGCVEVEEAGSPTSCRPLLAAGPLGVIQRVLNIRLLFCGGPAAILSDLFPPVGQNMLGSVSVISLGQARGSVNS